MVHVRRDLAIENGEEFNQNEKNAYRQRIGHDFGQGLDGLSPGVELREPLQDHAEEDQQGRTGGEGRGEKARGHDGRQPEAPARQTRVNERGDRVDADGPRDGEVDDRLHPGRRRDALPVALQNRPAGDDVDQQIAVEDHHVPEEDRLGRRVENHVHRPVEAPQVHQDEGEAHDHRGDGQEFPEDGDLPEGLVVVEVVRHHQHHRRSRDTYEKGELGDVEPPRDVPAHAGDPQAVVKLLQVKEKTDPGQEQQERHPDSVSATSFQGFFEHGILTTGNRSAVPFPTPAFSGGRISRLECGGRPIRDPRDRRRPKPFPCRP